MNKAHINMTLPEPMLRRIDKERKDMPRSRYITRLLESALNIPQKERTEYD